MKQLSRVVWSEGMYLGPHDFQVQNRWFENCVDFATRALWFEHYGLLACTINRERLLNGSLSVTHARGIFPDGLIFEMGDYDPLPEARNVQEYFPAAQEHLIAYLAIPSYKPNSQNVGDGSSGFNLRYSALDRQTVDENTGLDERVVTVARKNIRILFDSELETSLERLPIARIRRASAGKYILDDDFVPVCLRLAASPRLLALCEQLIGILTVKAESLAPASANDNGQQRAIRSLSRSELDSFWLRHALNSALPLLRHLCTTQQGHPEELFRELSRLAGALCTFAGNSHPNQLPHYEHDNLDNCFRTLDQFIRLHLNLLDPPNCVVIPLRGAGDSYYYADIKDPRCLGPATWLLGVRARVDEPTLIAETPRSIKVCSRRFIADIVQRAVPGLTLRHIQSPPSAASPRHDTQYFSVHQDGPCWTTLADSKQVGVHVPGKLPDPELELVILLKN